MLNLTADQTTILAIGVLATCILTLLGSLIFSISSVRSHRALRVTLQHVSERLDLTLGELHSQEQTIARLDSRAQANELGTGNLKSFDAAVRMARTGASTDHLAANSGLTKQEARLLARLHGPDRARA